MRDKVALPRANARPGTVRRHYLGVPTRQGHRAWESPAVRCAWRSACVAPQLPWLRSPARLLECCGLVSGRPPAASAAGGKSGLPRAGWWVTPTVRKDRERATENRPPDGPRKRATARVKRRGKSSPRSRRLGRHGKPHPEEDRIGGSRGPRCGPRVGRWRPSARTVLEKWPSPPTRRHQNPAYGDQALLHGAAPGGRRRRPSR